MEALNQVIDDEDIVVTGVGQHQMFASHYLYRRNPRTFVSSGGAGTMGFCLPAAIGAALATPERNIWAIDGDGSFQMTMQELGTLSATGAKVVILVVDNGYLGMVRQWQELFHERRYSEVRLDGSPDFVKIAEAFGIESERVATKADLNAALDRAKSAKSSMLIHIPVEQESNIMPMIPPGGNVSDFFGNCITEKGQFFSPAELAAIQKTSRGNR
jgi:acetolactate synthase-1/2/3 large subunit